MHWSLTLTALCSDITKNRRNKQILWFQKRDWLESIELKKLTFAKSHNTIIRALRGFFQELYEKMVLKNAIDSSHFECNAYLQWIVQHYNVWCGCLNIRHLYNVGNETKSIVLKSCLTTANRCVSITYLFQPSSMRCQLFGRNIFGFFKRLMIS